MPGPAPKPTALRLIEGNPSKRKLPKREPKPSPGAPKCPQWASGAARKHWAEVSAELQAMGVLTSADRIVLTLLADALAQYLEAKKQIEIHGLTFETDKGYVGAHPAYAMMVTGWERVLKAAKEFGLTPASRTKVQTAGAEVKRDEFEDFMEKRA